MPLIFGRGERTAESLSVYAWLGRFDHLLHRRRPVLVGFVRTLRSKSHQECFLSINFQRSVNRYRGRQTMTEGHVQSRVRMLVTE